MNGIINLLKPPCLSSAQAVSFIKRLTKYKVGHAGTLDPEACGVLPVMIGKATRLFDYIAEKQKVYVAEIAFGLATDTQDASGETTRQGDNYPGRNDLSAVLSSFTGTIMQCPPAYSAIKKDGKPLYSLARDGVMVRTEPRPISIEKIELLNETNDYGFLLRIYCGKGTYIRTLCHDIGIKLNCPSHMRMLIREKTGPFHIEEAVTIEEFEQAVTQKKDPGSWLMSMEDIVSYLPQITAPSSLWKPCVNGAAIQLDTNEEFIKLLEGSTAVIRCCNELIGVYQKKGPIMKVRTMLYT